METEHLNIGEWKYLEAEKDRTGQNLIPTLFFSVSYKSGLVTTVHFRKVTIFLRNAN